MSRVQAQHDQADNAAPGPEAKRGPEPAAAPHLAFELVLPAYNEGASLPKLVRRALAAAGDAGLEPHVFRLVVVDNGSSDDTQGVLAGLVAELPPGRLGVVHVPRNQGYGHGLWAGLCATTAPYVGWTHADEQCDPADAFAALACAQAGGGRTLAKGVRAGRSRQERLVSRTFEACARVVLGLDAFEANAQPKVLPRALLNQFDRPPADFGFDLYALYAAKKHGYAVACLPVQFAPRAHGVSRWAVGLSRRWRTIGGMLLTLEQIRQREGRLGRS